MEEHRQGRAISRLPDWAVLLLFCLVFSFQVILAATQKSATFDEPANLVSGYVELRFGDYFMLARNLPFVKWLAALPLLFVDVKVPPAFPFTHAWAFAQRFLYEVNDGDRLLLLGRLAVLPLSLLLGGLIFRWTQEFFGRPAGLLALFLYCFEPNLLAHAGLITTDLAVTLLMFGMVYGMYRVSRGGISLTCLLLPGVALGLALLTKYTMHPLVLILLLLALVTSLSPRPLDVRLPGLPRVEVTGWGRKLAGFLLLFLGWSVIAYFLIWAAYRFRYEASLLHLDPLLPSQPFLRGVLLFARDTRILPEAYIYGFLESLRDSGRYPAFLMGEVRLGSWWYYFLVTFFLKTPVSLLLLVLLAVGVQAKRWRETAERAAFLCLPVVVYFITISSSGYGIGHRHLLPIYPFLLVWVGGLVPWARQSARGGRWVQGALAALALWYAGGTVAIAPDYLAYFNELVGGPNQGYKYLVDSNLDWGQDLKGLKRYMDARGIDRVWLSYFGSASPEYYGIRYNLLPSYYMLRRSREQVPTPFVAISATNLQGVHLHAALGVSTDFFKEFRDRQPIAKIGYSIFVYRLE